MDEPSGAPSEACACEAKSKSKSDLEQKRRLQANDDVALNCLLRLPIDTHPACRAVYKRWHSVLGSGERFFTPRRQLGFRAWHTIPPVPCPCRSGFRSVGVGGGGTLLMLGGVGGLVEERDSPIDSVKKYAK
ncbi:hypothetical protein Syun_029838 [Stephania yunnanensis]|uniref:F-box domain-containing protein n=1 Tax=Stephania yunnanensis TaxID=152371 RepID=A0AAP0EEM1_9MAGN